MGNLFLEKMKRLNLVVPVIKSHKTNSIEPTIIESHSNTAKGLTHALTISHEDEKTALAFFLAGGFTIWNIFR